MRNLNQLILKFDYEQNFKYDDYYVSNSNKYPFNIITSWPKWEKKFINVIGEKFSGKTHLINVFLKKFNGIKINANLLDNDFLNKIKIYENVVVEDLHSKIDEKLFFTLMNIIDQDNKYLIITSEKPIDNIRFKLNDLNSRAKNFLLTYIENPEDDLIYAIILKNLSDRQIIIEKKLIEYIIKRVERSYSKIFDFIYKIDEISLKKKKPIDFKIIREVLKG
tara:strand:- start:491 stop:1153 length:663 start_codon:yes stop_codon:yes gene_type:complete